MAETLGRVSVSLPTQYLHSAAEAVGEAARILTDAQGQQTSGLDTAIKQFQRAADCIRATVADFDHVVSVIDSYLTSVLGFPGTVSTDTPCSAPVPASPAPPLPANLETHLFQGHATDTKITGYHHRAGGIDHGAFRVTHRQPPDVNGVYRATVEGPSSTGKPTRKQRSTFFPDTWTRDEVRHAVRIAFAYLCPVLDAGGNPRPRKWEGVYRGIRIQGFIHPGTDLDTAGVDDIATAYPVQQPRGGTP